MRTETGVPMGKCITPGCPVHIYPGEWCSDCGARVVPLTLWRQATDGAWSQQMADFLGVQPCRTASDS